MKYNDNGEYKDIYVKTFDTLPVGTEVDYDGSVVPDGWTDTTDSWHTLNSTIKYKKSGNVVTVTGFSSNTISLSENDYTTVGTLPSGYRPGEQLNNVWNELGVAYSNTIRIGTNGTIQLYSTKNTAYWVFTLTYVIDDKVIRKTSQYIEGGASLSNVYGTSNENGYTQEYINKQNEYSTDEIDTGKKWIDGKPVYRKCYQITKSSTGEVVIGQISSLDVITHFQTYLKRNDNYKSINNFYGDSSDWATAYTDQHNNIKYVSPYMGTLYVVLEYTKTTD